MQFSFSEACGLYLTVAALSHLQSGRWNWDARIAGFLGFLLTVCHEAIWYLSDRSMIIETLSGSGSVYGDIISETVNYVAMMNFFFACALLTLMFFGNVLAQSNQPTLRHRGSQSYPRAPGSREASSQL